MDELSDRAAAADQARASVQHAISLLSDKLTRRTERVQENLGTKIAALSEGFASQPAPDEISAAVLDQIEPLLRGAETAEARTEAIVRDLSGVASNVSEIWMSVRAIGRTLDELRAANDESRSAVSAQIVETAQRLDGVARSEQNTAARLATLEQRANAAQQAARARQQAAAQPRSAAPAVSVSSEPRDSATEPPRRRGLFGRRSQPGVVAPPMQTRREEPSVPLERPSLVAQTRSEPVPLQPDQPLDLALQGGPAIEHTQQFTPHEMLQRPDESIPLVHDLTPPPATAPRSAPANRPSRAPIASAPPKKVSVSKRTTTPPARSPKSDSPSKRVAVRGKSAASSKSAGKSASPPANAKRATTPRAPAPKKK